MTPDIDKWNKVLGQESKRIVDMIKSVPGNMNRYLYLMPNGTHENHYQ